MCEYVGMDVGTIVTTQNMVRGVGDEKWGISGWLVGVKVGRIVEIGARVSARA